MIAMPSMERRRQNQSVKQNRTANRLQIVFISLLDFVAAKNAASESKNSRASAASEGRSIHPRLNIIKAVGREQFHHTVLEIRIEIQSIYYFIWCFVRAITFTECESSDD